MLYAGYQPESGGANMWQRRNELRKELGSVEPIEGGHMISAAQKLFRMLAPDLDYTIRKLAAGKFEDKPWSDVWANATAAGPQDYEGQMFGSFPGAIGMATRRGSKWLGEMGEYIKKGDVSYDEIAAALTKYRPAKQSGEILNVPERSSHQLKSIYVDVCGNDLATTEQKLRDYFPSGPEFETKFKEFLKQYGIEEKRPRKRESWLRKVAEELVKYHGGGGFLGGY